MGQGKEPFEPARLGVGLLGVSHRPNITASGFGLLREKPPWRMNPDGAVDRRIGLMRIDREDGSPLRWLSNMRSSDWNRFWDIGKH